jgi:hypothetical protein
MAPQICELCPLRRIACVELSSYLLWGDSLITFSNSPTPRSLLPARLGMMDHSKDLPHEKMGFRVERQQS